MVSAKTLSTIAALSAMLVVSDPSWAAFQGTEVRVRTFGVDGYALTVYAVFDDPADRVVAVAGIPGAPLHVEVPGGVFYQNAEGVIPRRMRA